MYVNIKFGIRLCGYLYLSNRYICAVCTHVYNLGGMRLAVISSSKLIWKKKEREREQDGASWNRSSGHAELPGSCRSN